MVRRLTVKLLWKNRPRQSGMRLWEKLTSDCTVPLYVLTL